MLDAVPMPNREYCVPFTILAVILEMDALMLSMVGDVIVPTPMDPDTDRLPDSVMPVDVKLALV
eukprot:47763-Eustigmatos_ZCMA.PRE.1